MWRSVILVAAFLASTSLALACGTERWPVKTGTDRDAGKVNLTAQPATISALVSQPAPAHPNGQPDIRYAPTELTVFSVSAILKVIKRETAQDYHLVIADPQTGETMIAEAPDPECAAGGRFVAEISGARQQIEAQFQGQIRERHQVNIPVDVTGIAFFDPIHGQEGVAENGIELHPILSIEFH